jgi:neutral ceramidase
VRADLRAAVSRALFRAVVVIALSAGHAALAASPEAGTASGQTAPRHGMSDRCTGCLVAGAAAVVLPIPDGTPLAGYGSVLRRLVVPDVLGRHPHAFWFRPHTGELDAPGARALVLETDRVRVVWIAADLIAVDRGFTDAVERRLPDAGGRRTALVISASHTHSGPGAFLDSDVLGFAAVDRRDPDVREAIIGALVEAVRRADRTKTRARIGITGIEAPPVVAPRLAEPLDHEMVVMKVASDAGRPIAIVWNFAIHGTMLGPRNLRVSGDVMGMASHELERTLGVPALFVNGAVGDVSPATHGEAEASRTGSALAATAREAWRRITARDDGSPAIASVRVELPAPALSLTNCVGRWVPRALAVPLDGVFPRDATLVAIAVGDAAWVTFPGELQSALGRQIKRAAAPRWPHAFVAGVSNDYLGYFVDSAAWARPAYVACASLYGPRAGDRLVEAASGLLRALGNGQR